MNVLICAGSFKDTYTSIDFAEQIKNLISKKNHVTVAPFCDGGEYTFEVLKYYFAPQVQYMHNVYNSYLQLTDVPYIILDNQIYVFTSEIIRLSSEEDKYKNPLNLSDYGVGQALKYLYQQGHHRINLCIGGTSTTCCGAGAAQAMGMHFFDTDGKEIDKIICGRDLQRISKYTLDDGVDYANLEIVILADGDVNSKEMPGISGMKISRRFKHNDRMEIMREVENGVNRFSNIASEEKLGGFTGAAGGLIMGLSLVMPLVSCLGSEYFSRLFQIEDKVLKADVVITGEGRLDNSACGKSPFAILNIAKKYQRKTVYIVGSASEQYLQGAHSGVVRNEILKENGIDILLNCQYLYTNVSNDMPYNEKMELYKSEMMEILKTLLKEIEL